MNDDRRPPITPQLALRVAVLGAVALAAFAVIFFRLWFLQVLSGDQYVVQARENRARDIRIQAPRGEIVDRNGRRLVTNREARVVQLEPQELPKAERDAAAEWGQAVGRRLKRPRGQRGPKVPIPPIPTDELRERYQRLGRVLGMRARDIHRRAIEQLAVVPYSNVTVKSDVPDAVLAYLEERREQFRGVAPDTVFLRQYPHDDLAAQLLGYVGQISPRELRAKRNRGIAPGTIIGKAGIEYTYDRYLRGTDGAIRLVVNAFGENDRARQPRRKEPEAGNDLRLSLDLSLQESGQEALRAIGGGLPGAFVAMNPRSGAVHALGSYPSFDPAVFAKPISAEKYEALTSEDLGAPLFNRAIGGFYPTGSTFKPITSVAGLQTGVITPGTTVSDGGCVRLASRDWCNAGKVPNGPVALRRALQVSSDVYYYLLGNELNPLDGEPLQRWARRLGLGRRTGIDIPAEGEGLVPDRRWRARIGEAERRCRRRNDGQACGISDMRPWSVGDNINLSIGQGDVQASPLQMAVAYAGILNGDGRIPRPHLGLEVMDSYGRMLQRIEPGAARRVRIPGEFRAAIRDGLAASTSAPGGTSTDVFEGWPHSRLPVYGKTGTAETARGDQSWYVAYVPHPSKPLVVAVTVERGGFGAERAAPISRLLLSEWFGVTKKVVRGKSGTR